LPDTCQSGIQQAKDNVSRQFKDRNNNRVLIINRYQYPQYQLKSQPCGSCELHLNAVFFVWPVKAFVKSESLTMASLLFTANLLSGVSRYGVGRRCVMYLTVWMANLRLCRFISSSSGYGRINLNVIISDKARLKIELYHIVTNERNLNETN
jgi:hypothetical protein